MKLHRKLVVGLLIFSGILFSACDTKDKTAAVDKEDQVFNYIERQEMPTVDLSLATDDVSFIALNNIYEGLYRLDQENMPQPAGAAEKATISQDGLTYKVKLRKEAKWSDGEPVKAKDYVYSWQRTIDPKTTAGYAYMYEPVKNAKKIIDGKMDKSKLGIKATGDYELEITLEEVTPYFDYLLALPAFFPQRQDIVEKYRTQYAKTSEDAVYNGPFVLTDFDGPGTDVSWSYKKNKNYWDKKTVKLQKINVNVVKDASTALNLFQDGQADDTYLSGDLAQQLRSDPNFVIQQAASIFYIELNQKGKDSPYKNVNLRKAISYGIDRKSLVDKVVANGSTVAKGLVTEDLAFDPVNHRDFIEDVGGDYTEYNPEKAKEYWAKAKQELNIDKLEMEMLVDDTDNSKKMAEFIQAELADTLDGVTVKVSPIPFAVRLDRSNKGDFQLSAAGWSADYADPSSFLDLFTSNNPYNRGGFSNQKYDQLMEESETTNANKPEARWQNMVDAEKIFMENMGVIPLYQQGEARMRAEKVKGIVYHSTGAKYDFKWTYIK